MRPGITCGWLSVAPLYRLASGTVVPSDFRRQPTPPEITAQGDATDRAAPLHGVHFTPMAADVVSACGQSVHPQLGAFKMLLMGDLLDAKRDGLKWSVSA